MHVPLRGSSAGLVDQATGKPLGSNADVRFAPYGTDGAAGVVWPSGFGVQQDGDRVMADSPYAQLYALTQQIRRSTKTPYDFVQAVLDRVQSGTTYDENPPQRPYPLAAFLFDTKTGYCQQFSGVMALMLRMGGVPARVASGFSPGSYNSERKDYVVRDTDAHSWVEAYFPPYGWITFDPTPAASPATSQLDDTGTSPNGGPTLPPNFGGRLGQSGDRPFAPGDPGAGVAPTQRGRRLEAARRRGARGPHGAPRRLHAVAPAHAVRDARAGGRRAAARAAPLRARPVARRDARAPGERARRLRCGRGLHPRGTRPPLRALDGAADRRAAPRAAPPARLGPRPARARCAHGGRSRRCRAERSRIAFAVRTLRSRHGQRVRPLHERDRAAGQRRLPRRRRAAGARPRPRARQGLGARGARAARCSAPRRYREAAAEFEAVVEHAPTNDYALFCLGRSLQLQGRHAEARKPLALASCLRPEREDYSKYLGQARRRAA